jgi:hypothetical protein
MGQTQPRLLELTYSTRRIVGWQPHGVSVATLDLTSSFLVAVEALLLARIHGVSLAHHICLSV